MSNSDIDRLTKLLETYEQTNQQNLLLIEGFKTSSANLTKKISDLEKNKVNLNKRNQNLEQTLKYEKISIEGIVIIVAL